MNNNVYCTKHHLMILNLHDQEAIAELQEGKGGGGGSSSLALNANTKNSPWSSIAIDRQSVTKEEEEEEEEHKRAPQRDKNANK